MSTKHLSRGSTCPPNPEGKLRLYSMRFCPFVERVHLVLEAKNIPHDVVYINLMKKPKWFLERFPHGKVPALETSDGRRLYESLIAADYLDDQFPGRRLQAADPLQRAQDRILIELFDKGSSLVYRFIHDPDNREHHFNSLLTELDVMENNLAARGTAFFSGASPGMPDYMVWPWFERIASYAAMGEPRFVMSKRRHPGLVAWQGRMEADPAVKKWRLAPEVLARFANSYMTGPPDYDMPLN